MSDTNSPILNLLLMGDGLHTNSWGDATNSNLSLIETAMKGATSVAITGTTQNLTQAEAATGILIFTGTLTGNTTITVPATANVWAVINKTTGAYTLTLTTGSGASVVVPQSSNRTYICDGTNIYDASPQTDIVPIGGVIEYASATPPVMPNSVYMRTQGQAISRSTYAALYAIIGTTFGVGNGATTFNLPDTQGRTTFDEDNGTGRLNGWSVGQSGGAATATLSIDNLAAHSHTIIDPGHLHTIVDPGHAHTGTLANLALDIGLHSYDLSGSTPYITGRGNYSFGTAPAETVIAINSTTTGIEEASVGSGTPFSILPPLLVMPKYIRVL